MAITREHVLQALANILLPAGEMPVHPCEVQLDGGQDLADLVMQVAGHPRTFFLSRAPHALRQGLKLFPMHRGHSAVTVDLRADKIRFDVQFVFDQIAHLIGERPLGIG